MPATVSDSGKRQRKYFKTRQEAQNAVDLEKVRVTNFGTCVALLSPEARRDAARAEQILTPLGVSILQAAKEFAAAKQILDPINASVVEAAEVCYQQRIAISKSCSLAELFEEFEGAVD